MTPTPRSQLEKPAINVEKPKAVANIPINQRNLAGTACYLEQVVNFLTQYVLPLGSHSSIECTFLGKPRYKHRF